jgi:ring-1,2-phenylacetyl-CoA epoxidase subunit PaaE
MSVLFHPLRVSRIEQDTDDARVITLDVPDNLRSDFAFVPGQHLTLRTVINGHEARRSYSICSGLDEAALRIGVRRVNGGLVSGWLHDHLKVNDQVEVMPPEGRFCVQPDPKARRHYLGIAGGSGITPLLSIMKSVLAREPGSRFTLLYGNRRQQSTIFKEEIEDLKNRYLTRLSLHLVFSQEHMEAPLSSGRLDRAGLARFLGPLVAPGRIDQALVCGPHAFNDEVEAALLDASVAPERIHIERFGIPPSTPGVQATLPEAAGSAQARVTVIRDGLRREIDFQAVHGNLLEAAAQAGLEVPYSCKSGVCCTCRARLLEGEVRMLRNFALDKKEVAAGFILSCQAQPLTERVVISFDER